MLILKQILVLTVPILNIVIPRPSLLPSLFSVGAIISPSVPRVDLDGRQGLEEVGESVPL